MGNQVRHRGHGHDQDRKEKRRSLHDDDDVGIVSWIVGQMERGQRVLAQPKLSKGSKQMEDVDTSGATHGAKVT